LPAEESLKQSHSGPLQVNHYTDQKGVFHCAIGKVRRQLEIHHVQITRKVFVEGKLNRCDLKPAVAKVINELIEPVRKHFETNQEAKNLL
jgi:hypothetical protein